MILSHTSESFLNIWLNNPSWSPIYRTSNGWTTAKSKSGKQIPLTRSDILRAFSKHSFAAIIGKRFGSSTNYLMVDIDKGSQYHPQNGTIQPIIEAMEELGLCRHLIVQSSRSQGLHLYFPLPVSCKTWAIASTVHKRLTSAGINIEAGQCELFPNKKAYGSDYQGHRLPLQEGSFLLDDDFFAVSDRAEDFVAQWNIAADCQDIETFKGAIEKPAGDAIALPSFTVLGQTNKILMQLARVGARKGLRNVAELAQWIRTTVRRLPGFVEYCSRASKRDIQRRWPMRLAKWVLKGFKIKEKIMKKARSTYNDDAAAEALSRIVRAMQELTPNPEYGARAMFDDICRESKALFGVGISPRTFKKHRALIEETLKAKELPPPRIYGCEGSASQTQQESQVKPSPLKQGKEEQLSQDFVGVDCSDRPMKELTQGEKADLYGEMWVRGVGLVGAGLGSN